MNYTFFFLIALMMPSSLCAMSGEEQISVFVDTEGNYTAQCQKKFEGGLTFTIVTLLPGGSWKKQAYIQVNNDHWDRLAPINELDEVLVRAMKRAIKTQCTPASKEGA